MLVKICGTVSPHCYNNKNCPGFLIQEGKSKILLDCGNGIISEMNMDEDLNNLIVIISHLHKDHYGDILSLAYITYVYHNLGLLDKKVKVFIPKPNLTTIDATYINLYGDKVTKATESTVNDYNFLTNLGIEQYLEFETYDENTILNIDNLKITFARNPHQVNTYSTKVTSPSANIVYSSDTGFKGNILEEFAKNTDLLICESSFLEGQVRKSDNHLYASEAGLIAQKAKPSTLLLTHFWPSIPKENYLEEAKNIYPNTDVAEEGKVLRLERRNYNDRFTYS